MTSQTSLWDPALIEKYNLSGPRYTSYPTALEFHEQFSEKQYIKAVESLQDDAELSIYLHVPFCEQLCYYCACNKIVTTNKDKARTYVHALVKEIEMMAEHAGRKTVKQIHWGGGSPTFLSMRKIAEVMTKLTECFSINLNSDIEVAMEIDPRTILPEELDVLVKLGFNRFSLGIQDFNLDVQTAINRLQPFEQVEALMNRSRELGIQSINFDLIYGLPNQTVEGYQDTLEKVIALSPDRISVFNYAHMPNRFRAQKLIATESLPKPDVKLAIFDSIIHTLTEDGYVYIGMDHFAKPDNELTIAQQTGKLHRNFQGYTTHPEYELLAFGVSAISQVAGHYHQNIKTLKAYQEAVESDQLPTWRGNRMTDVDHIRKAVIFDLICHFELTKAEIEDCYNINFDVYFADELERLKPMEVDGLIELSSDKIRVTQPGRLLIRNICMVFDAYLNPEAQQFSKVI